VYPTTSPPTQRIPSNILPQLADNPLPPSSSFIIPPTSAKTYQSEPEYYKLGYSLHIQPSYITVLPIWDKPDIPRTVKQRENEENLRSNKHKGTLSPKAQKRVRNAVNWLVQSARPKRVYDKKSNKNYTFRVNFITLTLPGTAKHVTDHYFKRVMLHRFINNCRYKYGLRNYIWKVETQGNGRIHAHFTTDTYIHYHAIRRTWNKICESEGLIEEYASKYGNRNPPSTEVKSVRKVKKIAAYISKEMAKQDNDRRPIKGKLWSCSYSLSANNKCVLETFITEAGECLRPLIDSNIKMMPLEREVNRMGLTLRYGELYYMTPEDWEGLKGTEVHRIYQDHRFKIRHQLQDFPPEYFESLEHSLTFA